MKKGFTLIELLILIAILAIFIVLSNFTNSTKFKEENGGTKTDKEECKMNSKIYKKIYKGGSCHSKFDYCRILSRDGKMLEICMAQKDLGE